MMTTSTKHFCVLMTSSGQDSLRQQRGLKKCQAIIAAGDKIALLFLQYDAVYLANHLAVIPEEEDNFQNLWQQFILENNIPSKICVNSALKRGILDDNYAKLYQKPTANILPGFTLCSLNEFFDTLNDCDKFLQI